MFLFCAPAALYIIEVLLAVLIRGWKHAEQNRQQCLISENDDDTRAGEVAPGDCLSTQERGIRSTVGGGCCQCQTSQSK